jgi:hypothetical protein
MEDLEAFGENRRGVWSSGQVHDHMHGLAHKEAFDRIG